MTTDGPLGRGRALIVGDPSVDPTGVMYEVALQARGIAVEWVPLAEILDHARDSQNISLLQCLQNDPYAVGIDAANFALTNSTSLRERYTLATVVSNDADPYLPVVYALLASIGLKQFNSAESVAKAQDKWATHVAFRDADMPIPHAVLVNDMPEVRRGASELGYPIVVKQLKGTQGSGVRLARTDVELATCAVDLEIDRQPLMLEHYIECDATDKRLIIVEGSFVAGMTRHAKEGDFRANLSLGGFPTPSSLTDVEKRLAERGAEVLGLRLAGMDMAVVADVLPGREYLPAGSPFFIEANPAPALDGPLRADDINGADIAIDMLLRDV